MIKTACLIFFIWLCLSQISLNQHQPRKHTVKRIQSKDLKKNSNLNHQISRKNVNAKHSSKVNPFQDFIGESSGISKLSLAVDDQWNNNVVNNWNSNNWQPSGWSAASGNGWSNGKGWNNGWWWEQDPWKDPYTKLTLVKIKPEIQEVYAADVLIRENRNSNFGINGFVQFVQFENFVEVNGIICNLPPGKHAIHIHKFGEISGGCHETLGDFNPYNLEHGAPEFKSRHLGDLGNIEANATGIAVFRFKDKQIKVQDKVRGIIGRSVVIHEFEDDMGLTQTKESGRTGDSGGRLGCGVIGISQPSNYATIPMTCNRKN